MTAATPSLRAWAWEAGLLRRSGPRTVVSFDELLDAAVGAYWENRPRPHRPRPKRVTRPCGTRAGYLRHRAAAQPPCAACVGGNRQEERDKARRRRGYQGPRPLAPCGTHAAFTRHRTHGEPVDDACLAAERAYQRERAHRRRRDIDLRRAS